MLCGLLVATIVAPAQKPLIGSKAESHLLLSASEEFHPLLTSPFKKGRNQLLPPLVTGRVGEGLHKDFVAILVWHDVLPAKEVWFDTTLARFKQQLAEIQRRKLRVISLDAYREHLINTRPLPARSIVLTFDDNTEGLYYYAK